MRSKKFVTILTLALVVTMLWGILPALGAYPVDVEGIRRDVIALKASGVGHTETPEPTSTPVETPEPTPTPTETPKPNPTPTPEPTATPEPTETPELPQPIEVRFEGVIEALPEGSYIGTWVVAGQGVQVTESTEIEGTPQVGVWVSVKANLYSDGSLVAIKIKVKTPKAVTVEFKATIKALPEDGLLGEWVIGDHTVTVDESTQIEGDTPDVGDWAEVKAQIQADGSLLVLEIEVKDKENPPAQEVDFKGPITALPETADYTGVWTIGCCHQVTVTTSTIISGTPEVGLFVEVKALKEGPGAFVALEIVVEASPAEQNRYRFEGTVEALPSNGLIGQWQINGQPVMVDENTIIDQSNGPIGVGVKVEVEVQAPGGDGIPAAIRIEVLHPAHSGSQEVEIRGVIESLPEGESLLGTWVVAGEEIMVDANTEIHGVTPQVGLWAIVKAVPQDDGSLLAQHIEVKGHPHEGSLVEFTAQVISMPDGLIGEWQIGGYTVMVDENTEIEGSPAVGSMVKVEATIGEGGVLLALKIEVIEQG